MKETGAVVSSLMRKDSTINIPMEEWTMLIAENEVKTIEAINEINKLYPYAATLLVYALIERVLKQYIIRYRGNKQRLDHDKELQKKGKVLILKDFINYNEDKFIKHYIKKIALGDIPSLVKKFKNPDFAKLRNDYMHSNIYLSEQHKKPDNIRHSENEKGFIKAAYQLESVLNTYSTIKVVFRKEERKLLFKA
jgi:hypothetical protein